MICIRLPNSLTHTHTHTHTHTIIDDKFTNIIIVQRKIILKADQDSGWRLEGAATNGDGGNWRRV